jgi:hypothetical protein
MAQLIAAFVPLWWLFSLMVLFTFGVMWPLMAWSVTRNIKSIRQQLERLNITLEAQSGPRRAGTLGI